MIGLLSSSKPVDNEHNSSRILLHNEGFIGEAWCETINSSGGLGVEGVAEVHCTVQ